MTLRGAGVQVDARRVGGVIVGGCVVGLAALTIVLFLAGAQKNAQIDRLRQHGVPVDLTVSGCLGLLGGSGSNAAGYACRGTFTLDGHRYNEAIPGDTFHPPGATLRAVSVPGDPALVSTISAVTSEHASSKVFVLPTILLIVLVTLAGALVLRRRRSARSLLVAGLRRRRTLGC